MGQRITKLNPFGGFAAETAGGLTSSARLPLASRSAPRTRSPVPLSASELRAVFLLSAGGITRRIVWAWVLTIPGAALFGAIIFHAVQLWAR